MSPGARVGPVLAALGRIVELRTQGQWREVLRARELEAQRRRERDERQQELDRATARLRDCQAAIAAVRRRPFSPYDARGHRAAEERLAQAQFERLGQYAVAQERLAQATAVREAAHAQWLRLRSRGEALADLARRHGRGQALREELLRELVQDEDHGARAPLSGTAR